MNVHKLVFLSTSINLRTKRVAGPQLCNCPEIKKKSALGKETFYELVFCKFKTVGFC